MTRKQWEQKVIDHVIEHGGFSIFWVTQNQFLASAADRLRNAGRLAVSNEGTGYPCSWAVIIPYRWRCES